MNDFFNFPLTLPLNEFNTDITQDFEELEVPNPFGRCLGIITFRIKKQDDVSILHSKYDITSNVKCDISNSMKVTN